MVFFEYKMFLTLNLKQVLKKTTTTEHCSTNSCTKHFDTMLRFYLIHISYPELKTLQHSVGVV